MTLAPFVGQRSELFEHLLGRQDRALRAIRLLDRHAEAHHQAVAGHVEHRAVVLESDFGQQAKNSFNSSTTSLGQPLGDAR